MRISHMLLTSLLMLVYPLVQVMADDPATPSDSDFPPDPGVVYVPPVVVIMGDTIDMSDSTQVLPVEYDVLGDQTVIYNTEENTLTLTNASMEVGETEGTAISYSGSDSLTIILRDTSRIAADTIISSQSNVLITGDGAMEAVGQVPIIGVPEANITFDSVAMHVKSVPSAAALRRYIRFIRRIKDVDETGGPALSGFGSADFNKVNVTPGDDDASYGPITGTGGGEGGEEDPMYALYVTGEDGEQEVLTEFWLTPEADETALPVNRQHHELDTSAPMYNILGLPVDASYQGIVIQNGRKYFYRINN